MMRLLSALALISLCGAAYGKAEPTNVVKFSSTHSSMLSGVALNATASDRTVTLSINGSWAKLRLGIDFTRSAATTVTAQFTCQYTSGGTYYRKTTRNCSSGTCTVYEQSDSNPVSGDQDFELEYDVRGCNQVQVLLGGASAGASDIVSTEATFIVGE